MRMRFWGLTALLLTTVLSPVGVAQAAQPKGAWHTGAMREANGNFVYCVSEVSYDNGLWLLMALNPAGEVNLGVGFPEPKLQVGQQKKVLVQIDNHPAEEVMAQATKPVLMVLSAGRSTALLDALARANQITIDGNVFALKGSAEAVGSLAQCVAEKGGAVPAAPTVSQQNSTVAPVASAPVVPAPIVYGDVDATQVPPPGVRGAAPSPFAPLGADTAPLAPAPAAAAVVAAPQVVTSPIPPANVEAIIAQSQAVETPPLAPQVVAAQPALPASLPQPLMDLLLAAGLLDVKALAAVAPASFAWQAKNDLSGQISEMPIPVGVDIPSFIEAYLQQQKPLCGGAFTSLRGISAISPAGVKLQTAAQICRTTTANIYSTYVFAASPSGALSIVRHDIDGGRRAAADKAQAGLMTVLKTR